MAMVTLTEFIKQVRQESSKVTWSTRKDAMVSTVVVLVMIMVASIFFLIVDAVVFNVVQAILGF
jgi:preprotein translocase subunit SecE